MTATHSIRPLKPTDAPGLEELAQSLGQELYETGEALCNETDHLCLGLFHEQRLTAAIFAWLDNTLQHNLAEDVVLVDGILGDRPKAAIVKKMLNGVVSEMERLGLPELPLEVRLRGKWKLSPPERYRKVWKREVAHPEEKQALGWWRFESLSGGSDE